MDGYSTAEQERHTFFFQHGQRQQHVRGEYTTVKAGFYLNKEMNDDIYYTAWLDRKPVSILHTIPTMQARKLYPDGEDQQRWLAAQGICEAYNNSNI